jgi:lysozyme
VSDNAKGTYTNPALITLALAVLTGGGYIGISESDEDAITNGLIAADLKQNDEAASNYKELLQRIHTLETEVEVLKAEMNFNKIKTSLREHEGVVAVPYQDSKANWTIGIGHLCSNPISQAAMEQILEDDIHEAAHQLNRHWPNWVDYPENIQDTVIELAFNMGIKSLLSFEKMRAALDDGDYNEAAAQLLLSKYADQVGARAQTLAERIMEL